MNKLKKWIERLTSLEQIPEEHAEQERIYNETVLAQLRLELAQEPAVLQKEVEKTFGAVKDSGKRQEFQTGSKRDTREGKGRFDLIPTYPLRRLARHYENGAIKYGDKNWERGQPLSRYLDSCIRHAIGVLEGLTDEDHASAVSWNIFAYIATAQWIEEGKLPAELDDVGHTSKGQKP
jgi:hypothetical protein